MITFCDYSTLNILAANFLDFHPSFPGLIRYHPKIRCFAKKPTKWFSRYHWNFLSPTDLLKWLGSFSKWLSITDFWYLSWKFQYQCPDKKYVKSYRETLQLRIQIRHKVQSRNWRIYKWHSFGTTQYNQSTWVYPAWNPACHPEQCKHTRSPIQNEYLSPRKQILRLGSQPLDVTSLNRTSDPRHIWAVRLKLWILWSKTSFSSYSGNSTEKIQVDNIFLGKSVARALLPVLLPLLPLLGKRWPPSVRRPTSANVSPLCRDG